ncbi:hypothetical protein HDU91_002523, partial [Kappamyces sp. JEL0680]
MSLPSFEATPFDKTQYSFLVTYVVLSGAGAIANLVWFLHLKATRSRSNVWTLSVALADGINALLTFIIDAIHVHNNSFSTGFWGCQVFGFQDQMLAGTSLVCFLMTSADPFLVTVVKANPLTAFQTKLLLLQIWLGIGLASATLPLWPISSNPYYHL